MRSLDLTVRRSRRHVPIQRLVAMGAALGLASASGQALAQDCTLSVRATPNVISAGQQASVDVPALPDEQLMLNYTEVDPPPAGGAGMYEVSADLIDPPGTSIRFDAFRGGVHLATELVDEQHGRLWMSRVPDQIGVGVQRERAGGAQLDEVIISSCGIQANNSRIVFNGLVVEVDRVTLTARRMVSTNNLRQISLGCHVFEASGVSMLTIISATPRR